MNEDISRELGAISATLEHIKGTQEKQGETLSKVEERLRTVETRSLINAGVAGGLMSVAVAFAKDAFRA